MAKKATQKKTRKPLQQGPMVALYNLDGGTPHGDAVRDAVASLGIRVRTITTAHLNDSVGSIAGMVGMRPSPKPYDGDAPDDEFMLVCNLSSKQLDQMLAALRQADANVALKAQVTQHNRLWPLRVLMAEIAKEHAAMTGQAD